MSPRPRKVSDEEIFAAANRAMTRLGPAELTLAEIAGEADLTPGALVQRFGSKRKLQVALARGAAASAGEMIAALRARHRSPLAAIRDYAECMAHLASSPAALARNLAYLTADISDPELRKHLLAQSRSTRAALQGLVAEAIDKAELRPRTDAAALARTIETIIGGALLSYAIYRDGSAEKWLREHVDAVLAAHVPRRSR